MLGAVSKHGSSRSENTASKEAAVRVLQIEDDSKTAESVELILQAEGHSCDTARSGEIALELARATEYDLILLDIGLPGMDGYEVLNHLRRAGVTTPVIIQSGLVLLKNKVKDLGVEDYLTKPFGRRDLAESIENAVNDNAAQHS
jgi:two-component system cell cycle response regulator CtrA